MPERVLAPQRGLDSIALVLRRCLLIICMPAPLRNRFMLPFADDLHGADLRGSPIEERKQHLAWTLRKRHQGIAVNATYDGDGEVIYQHACTLGCEGIVSKRLGSAYRAGRTDQWLKMKNPEAPAVRRERDIDWAKR